ncbi:MAG: flagellar hook-associated protein FlgL [Eubacteriales bacterium]
MLRVSNIMMTNSLVKYIQNNLNRTALIQERISTGKTINRPSDNPTQISRVMSVNATITGNEQYIRNIDDGLSYLEQCDSVLNTVGEVLRESKALTLQGANGTFNPDDRKYIAEQVDKQIDTLVNLGNSSLGGKYLFAGRKNGQPPFARIGDEIYYRGDTNRVTREVIFGSSYEVDAPGVKDYGAPDSGVFGNLTTTDPADPNYLPINVTNDPMDPGPPPGQMTRVTGGPLEVLKNLRDRLLSSDTAGIDMSLGELDNTFNGVLVHRVAVGARTRHLETVKSDLEEQEIKMKSILVDVQGADIAKLSIELVQNNMVHEASLMAASEFLKTGLINFLK